MQAEKEAMKAAKKAAPKVPKRPINGYLAFSSVRRPQLKMSDPQLGFADLTKKIATEWHEMSAEEKIPYNKISDMDKKRYCKEMLTYKTE